MDLTNSLKIAQPNKDSGFTVMLTGSDPISLKLMKIFIERFVKNTNVEIFKNACDVLTNIRNSSNNYPDILITDLDMPTMSGLELIEAINHFFRERNGERPPFRIVICTNLFLDTCQSIEMLEYPACCDHLKTIHKNAVKPVLRELPIDALVTIPLDTEKIGFIFNHV